MFVHRRWLRKGYYTIISMEQTIVTYPTYHYSRNLSNQIRTSEVGLKK